MKYISLCACFRQDEFLKMHTETTFVGVNNASEFFIKGKNSTFADHRVTKALRSVFIVN